MKYSLLLVLGLASATSALAIDYKRDLTAKECPVVGNKKSKIFHIAGQKGFKNMLKKSKKSDNRKCFKSVETALKAGFRKAKG